MRRLAVAVLIGLCCLPTSGSAQWGGWTTVQGSGSGAEGRIEISWQGFDCASKPNEHTPFRWNNTYGEPVFIEVAISFTRCRSDAGTQTFSMTLQPGITDRNGDYIAGFSGATEYRVVRVRFPNRTTGSGSGAGSTSAGAPTAGTTAGSTTSGTTTSGAATSGAGTTSSSAGTTGGAAANTSSAGGTPSTTAAAEAERQRQAQAAEDARRTEAARRAAEAARLEAIDQTVTGVTNVAVGMAGAIAENRRMSAARRARLEAAREQYRQRIAAAFAMMPPRPQCTNARGIPVEIGRDYRGALTGVECRTRSQSSAVVYTLEVKERSKVAVALRSNFWPRITIANQATGAILSADEAWADLWLEPGVYNILAHSELAGEVGDFTVSVQPGRRSWAGGWQMGLGMDMASATADTYGGDFGGGMLAMRLGTPFRQGPAIEERFTLTLDVGYSEAITTADLGARLYLLGKTTAWRPYLQASYGFASLCSQGCIDSDILGPDYYYASGMAFSWSAGLHWYFSPQYAMDLGYISTSGSLDEGPMSMSRFRIGLAMHPGQPLVPR